MKVSTPRSVATLQLTKEEKDLVEARTKKKFFSDWDQIDTASLVRISGRAVADASRKGSSSSEQDEAVAALNRLNVLSLKRARGKGSMSPLSRSALRQAIKSMGRSGDLTNQENLDVRRRTHRPTRTTLSCKSAKASNPSREQIRITSTGRSGSGLISSPRLLQSISRLSSRSRCNSVRFSENNRRRLLQERAEQRRLRHEGELELEPEPGCDDISTNGFEDLASVRLAENWRSEPDLGDNGSNIEVERARGGRAGLESPGGRTAVGARGGVHMRGASARSVRLSRNSMMEALAAHRKTLKQKPSLGRMLEDLTEDAAANLTRSGSSAAGAARDEGDPRQCILGVGLSKVDVVEDQGLLVPWVVKRCICYLSAGDRMRSVGIFRVSGDPYELQRLKGAVNGAAQVVWDESKPPRKREGSQGLVHIRDINTVAQLLKAYLRELPDPVIPFEVYPQIIAVARAAEDANEKWENAVRSILWSIPSAHYNILRYLFCFLGRVAACPDNRMTSENLAIVFAPNLIRPRDPDPFVTLRDLKFQTDTVIWLLERCGTVFNDDLT
ncbi:unnamed protein product [Chrysoparadoxa australica]